MLITFYYNTQGISQSLTDVFIKLGFVSFPPEESSCGLPEKALGWAGDVEVWGRETAAGREGLWHEALRERNHTFVCW